MRSLSLVLLLPLAGLAQPPSQVTLSSGHTTAASASYRLALTATPGYWPPALRRPSLAKPVASPDSLEHSAALLPNLPNPFNPATTLRYTLPARTQVRLDIYNVLGQEVRTLVQQEQEPGFYTLTWDGLDQAGQPAASGVYFGRLQAGQHRRLVRMLLTK